jgi:hypothetical protein
VGPDAPCGVLAEHTRLGSVGTGLATRQEAILIAEDKGIMAVRQPQDNGCNTLDTALAYLQAGLSLLPIATDGSKGPHWRLLPREWDEDEARYKATWKPFEQRLPTADEVGEWCNRSHPPGIAIIGGQVSGGLECLDFDTDAETIFPDWCLLVEAECPGLVPRLNVTRTPKPGFHVRYRCREIPIPGNTKLAGDPARLRKAQTLLETRGEGGYALAPGSPPECHETGRTYDHHSGPPLTKLSTITAAERETLIRCARVFDCEPQEVAETPRGAKGDTGLLPGDDYCVRGPDWAGILEPHGWTCVGNAGGKRLWRRPDKEGRGWSATTGLKSKAGRELLCVFSCNAHPFPGPSGGKVCSTHNKFSAFALLNHGGDFAATAKALAEQGFGTHPPSPARPKPPRPKLLPAYRPFPVDALPEPICGWARAGAAALGCDPSFTALPALAAVASVIGNTRVILLKRGWTEPAILWTAIVGDSGTLKSPAHEQAVIPLYREQERLLNEYQKEMAEYLEGKAKRKSADDESGDPPPEPPFLRRVVCSDVTVEKVAALLEANPRGLLLSRDELAAWLGSFTRYKGKAGGTDLPNWLEMHRAGTVIVDRKTGDRQTLYIKRAAVSVCGGIQPRILARALTAEHIDAGLVARLLMAMPPRRPKVWSEAVVHEEVDEAYHKLFRTLLQRRYGRGEGPGVLRLDPAAKQLWVEWYNEWAGEQAAAEGEMAATLAKLEGGAARLALLHHVATMTHLETDDCRPVGLRSMEAGITLARWFAAEARRILAMLGESEQECTLRRLVEYIQGQGGRITVRALQKAYSRRYRTSEQAHEALDSLVQAGLGLWVNPPATPKGGQAAQYMELLPTADTTDRTGDVPEGSPRGVPTPVANSTPCGPEPHDSRFSGTNSEATTSEQSGGTGDGQVSVVSAVGSNGVAGSHGEVPEAGEAGSVGTTPEWEEGEL